MRVKPPDTLLEAASLTDDEARQLLEQIRWPHGAVCPHCGDINVKLMGGKATRPGLYKCYACRKQFTVTVGTVMHRSHITIKQWILAFYSIAAHKKGVSALQLQRDLGLGSYKSAWHLAHRIRKAMQQEPMLSLLSGVVEADETFVGGHGNPDKAILLATIERDGRAVVRPVPNIKKPTLQGAMKESVSRNARIHTDELRSYKGVEDYFCSHSAVNHSIGEYANGDVHINSCESYFALLKRGVHGTFHNVSKKHIERYCNEFSFRWDTRKIKDGDRMVHMIAGFAGKRLEYSDLIAEA